MANNLVLDPFPDPVGHFGAPWQPFWISRPLIGRNTRSARIKKLILLKWLKMANNLGLDPFPDSVGHFGAPSQLLRILHVVLWCSVAGGKRVPPAPLGCYISIFSVATFSDPKVV